MPGTCRHLCFTSFDLSVVDRLSQLDFETEVRYVVAQVEQGNDTGREHVQGYVEFFAPKRYSWWKRAIGDAATHCESRRGSREQARSYCTKLESRLWGPFEHGRWVAGGQGRRTDILSIKEAIDNGATPSDVADSYFKEWLRYDRAFDKYSCYVYLRAGVRRALSIHVLWGPTGTGKTYRCHAASPGAHRLAPPVSQPGPVWWDGYNGQLAVIIDDYDGWIGYRSLLQWFDEYPVLLPVKGSFTPARYTVVYVTSNKRPEEWHPDQDFAPLQRRLTSVTHVVDRDTQLNIF